MFKAIKLARMARGAIERVREHTDPVVERIETVRYDPPPIRLTHIIIIGLAWPLSLWAWGKYAVSQRDAFWRGNIAAASKSVRDAIAKGKALAELTDDEIIKGLKHDREEQDRAEGALSRFQNKPPPPVAGCARIPRHCMFGGVREQ